MKPWLITLALLAVAAPLWPEGNGTGQILLIEPSAQAGALGGAVVCADGLEGMDANPAGLGWLDRSEFSATHLAWVQGFTYEDVAMAMPLAVGALGLHGDIFSSPQVQQTDVNDQVLGSYSEQDLDLGLVYGLSLGPVACGLQMRYLRDSMLDLVQNGFSTDLGAEWRLPEGVVLGASLQNMGLMEGLGAESTQVPLVWRGAGSWEGVVAGISTRVEAGLYHLDGDTPEIRTGVEAGVEQTIFLRLGYCLSWTGDETRSYSLGAGLFLWGMHMDYAFVPLGVLGQTHRITLSSALGDLPGLRPEEDTRAYNWPLSVQVKPETGALEVSWAPPEGAPAEVAGYHLWLRKGAEPSPRLVSAGLTKGFKVLLWGLDPTQEYGVAVSAVDGKGREGHLSPEVKARDLMGSPLAKAAPAPPHGLRARRAWGQVVLDWQPSAEKDVDGYECFLRRKGPAKAWERMGMVEADTAHLAVDRDKVPRDVEAFVARAVRRVGHGFQAGVPCEEAGVPATGLW